MCDPLDGPSANDKYVIDTMALPVDCEQVLDALRHKVKQEGEMKTRMFVIRWMVLQPMTGMK